MPTKKTTKKATKAKKTTTRKVAKKVAKKTTKKVAAKSKTKVTKRASKTKPALVCAEGGDCFWVHDGPVLRDLLELRDALKEMDDSTFSYHANKERNDFADWIEYILGDKTLATSVRKSKKPHTARTLVVKRLRYYAV